MSERLFLLSCVAKKREAACPARDMYISPLFMKARAFVEQLHAPWFILSAEYGLVHPDAIIAPYDRTLNDMPVADRRRWAALVLSALEPHLAGVEAVVFPAGQRYREFLESALAPRLRVEVPMIGLSIGRQLKWLDRRRVTS